MSGGVCLAFDTSPAICRRWCPNYNDGTGDDIHLFGNEIISEEHHYKFHRFSFEPLLAITSKLQSITVLFASYIVTLSKLTNGQFLHTLLHPSMLCLFLFTAYFLNATFVPVYSQRGVFVSFFFFINATGLKVLLIWISLPLTPKKCPSKMSVYLLKTKTNTILLVHAFQDREDSCFLWFGRAVSLHINEKWLININIISVNTAGAM